MTGSPDLQECLEGFFRSHLIEQRDVSTNTLISYRDTFKLLIEFLRLEKGARRAIKVTDLEPLLLLRFLNRLEDPESGRGNSASTRNCRLAAIRSFFQYLAWNYPSLERHAKRIQGLRKKITVSHKLNFLDQQELKVVFGTIDTREREGPRNLAILTYLYNTGARSQEVADTRLSWIDSDQRTVSIKGKGRKERVVPLWETTLKAIKIYKDKYRRPLKRPGEDYLFVNQRGGHLTRFGVRRIVVKYTARAKTRCKSLQPKRCSTHSMRHTTAVHLLESGVELNVVSKWLGHASIETTSKYLDATLAYKKAALDRFAPPINVTSILPGETKGSPQQILDWLKGL